MLLHQKKSSEYLDQFINNYPIEGQENKKC